MANMVKCVINPDELKVNKGKLIVAGIVPILCTEIKGLKAEGELATLPDQTNVSGGRNKAGTFTIKIPAHHFITVRALEEWKKKAMDPQDTDTKKSATLIFLSGTNLKFKSWALEGVWVVTETMPDMELKDEGNEAEVEFTLSFDDINPIA